MTGQNTNLTALSAAGVAVWLDDLSRERLRSGNLAELGSASETCSAAVFSCSVQSAFES